MSDFYMEPIVSPPVLPGMVPSTRMLTSFQGAFPSSGPTVTYRWEGSGLTVGFKAWTSTDPTGGTPIPIGITIFWRAN